MSKPIKLPYKLKALMQAKLLSFMLEKDKLSMSENHFLILILMDLNQQVKQQKHNNQKHKLKNNNQNQQNNNKHQNQKPKLTNQNQPKNNQSHPFQKLRLVQHSKENKSENQCQDLELEWLKD